MKKIFKMFAVAFVALTTFVSAGCSCSLNDDKAKERILAFEKTDLYSEEGTNKNFRAVYQLNNPSSGNVLRRIELDTNFGENKFTYYSLVNGEEESTCMEYFFTWVCDIFYDFGPEETDGVVEGTFNHEGYVSYDGESKDIKKDTNEFNVIRRVYNRIKTQPGIVYTINPKSELDDVKAVQLKGLETADADFLRRAKYAHSATKELFNDVVTIVVEYDVVYKGLNKYRQTFVLNANNRLTSYKLEELINQTDKRGNRSTFAITRETLTITYK